MKWFYNEVPHFNKNDRNQGTSMKGKSGNLNIALKYQEILGNILTISDNVNILWNVIKVVHATPENGRYMLSMNIIPIFAILSALKPSGNLMIYQGNIRDTSGNFIINSLPDIKP